MALAGAGRRARCGSHVVNSEHPPLPPPRRHPPPHPPPHCTVITSRQFNVRWPVPSGRRVTADVQEHRLQQDVSRVRENAVSRPPLLPSLHDYLPAIHTIVLFLDVYIQTTDRERFTIRVWYDKLARKHAPPRACEVATSVLLCSPCCSCSVCTNALRRFVKAEHAGQSQSGSMVRHYSAAAVRAGPPFWYLGERDEDQRDPCVEATLAFATHEPHIVDCR
jgi:hypothetical protein